MIIGLDFDGTVVTHEYPNVGKDIGAVPVLKSWIKEGHKIVLNTMRSGKELEDAVKWFEDNGIPLYGVNRTPGQRRWTTSPKVHAHLYIDDCGYGVPLKKDLTLSPRPFVDWNQVSLMNK